MNERQTPHENQRPPRPLSPEEVQQRLSDAASWLHNILNEHGAHDEYERVANVSATTEEGWDRGVLGRLTVREAGNELRIELKDTVYGDEAKNGHDYIERYNLVVLENGSYFLEASGRQPDVYSDVLHDDKVDEEMFNGAMSANEEIIREAMHVASDDEVRRFYDLVGLGAFGDQPFNFEDFEFKFHDWLRDQESAKDEPSAKASFYKRIGRKLLGRD